MYRLLFLLVLTVMRAVPMTADERKWPDLPLLEIVTVDSVLPTCNMVQAPDGCIGASSRSEHVPGRMVMTLRGDTLYDSGEYMAGVSGMRLKIRGNSTGKMIPPPYKLKLTKKADLLMRGETRFKHKDWVLLSMYTWHPELPNHESNILTWTGNIVSRTVGMEWTPSTEFVNVVLNGRYQGLYTLTESVNAGEGRIKTEKSGYLIEHDTYFWNEDGYFFKSNRQDLPYGWTYKYPDGDEVTPLQEEYIRTYINRFEEKLYAGEETDDLIDYPSWARWILAHDFLGALDAWGTNRFLYKKDYLPGSPNSTKLAMCALWDFDSSLRCEANKFCTIHDADFYYFRQLFKLPKFRQTYIALYDSLKNGFYETVRSELKAFEEHYTIPFEESAALHHEKYPGQCHNRLHDQVEVVLSKLYERCQYLDLNIEAMRSQVGVSEVQTKRTSPATIYDLSGRSYGPERLSSLPPGIYIRHDAQGKPQKFILR